MNTLLFHSRQSDNICLRGSEFHRVGSHNEPEIWAQRQDGCKKAGSSVRLRALLYNHCCHSAAESKEGWRRPHQNDIHLNCRIYMIFPDKSDIIFPFTGIFIESEDSSLIVKAMPVMIYEVRCSVQNIFHLHRHPSVLPHSAEA